MIVVDLSPKGDRIFLRSPGFVSAAQLNIAGARFSKSGGAHWSIPLSVGNCRSLRVTFGTSLKVGKALSSWAREAIARESRLHSLGEANDATLTRLPEVSPLLAKAMAARTYQRSAVRFIVEALETGGALIADDPGLGKTLEAIGGIIESGIPGPYLVVCPKTAVEPVWSREIPRWWPGTVAVTIPDGKAKRDAILNGLEKSAAPRGAGDLGRTFLVVHPEALRTARWWECSAPVDQESLQGRLIAPCGIRTKWKAGPKRLDCGHMPAYGEKIDHPVFPQIFRIPWGVVIADESDRALIRRTGTPNLVRTGMENLPCERRIPMSGTPFRSRPYLLWGTLNWMFPKIYTSFWRFAETYFEISEGYGGSRTVGRLREDKVSELDFELRSVMLRRTKAEVAPDLPVKMYAGTPLLAEDPNSPVGVWLPMEPAQRALYDQMAAESSVAIEGGTLNAIGILAELTRLKQFATSAGRLRDGSEFIPQLPSNKFDWLVQHLIEMGFPDDPKGKIVVVSQFTQVLEMFERELSGALAKSGHSGNSLKRQLSVSVTGALTGKRRTYAIDAFNAEVGTNSPHVMFLQIKTGGVAITLDTADTMVFLDETWIPDDHIQAEDRIHRVSRPRPVTYYYLRSLETVEEGIARVNEERREISHTVLDGRRGIEYARRFLKADREQKSALR